MNLNDIDADSLQHSSSDQRSDREGKKVKYSEWLRSKEANDTPVLRSTPHLSGLYNKKVEGMI